MATYVDTAAWIALGDPRDGKHQDAKAAHRRLEEGSEAFVTGWHTVVEYTDGLARHFGQRAAATVLQAILESPSVEVMASEPHRERAVDLLVSRADWNVDLSDCLSFALMEATGIRRVFTYARDFEKAGFELVG